MSIFEQTQLHLTLLQGEKKTIFHLRTKDNEEVRVLKYCRSVSKNLVQANMWYVALTKDIQIQNIQALRQSCRIPEVVEWYYQYQSELNRKFGFLMNNTEVNLLYSIGSGRQTEDSVSSFNICVCVQ